MKLKDYLFPEHTKWAIVDVFVDRNAHYCLQIRSNKVTGMKQFKVVTILDSSFTAEIHNLTIEKLNELTI